jgi:hypothetical protein
LEFLKLKLIKIGARVVCHASAITFQLAEVAVTGSMVHHTHRHPPIASASFIRMADFTYVRTAVGFVYVAFIIDVFALHRRLEGLFIAKPQAAHPSGGVAPRGTCHRAR